MKNILCLFFIFLSIANSLATPLSKTELLVVSDSNGVPQVPVPSPDGKWLIYEVASKGKTSLWISSQDGKNAQSLTTGLQNSGALPSIIENASWHPSKSIITFEGSNTNGAPKIWIAPINESKLETPIYVTEGRRPRFSYPYGRALFCEPTNNPKIPQVIAIGENPMTPKSRIPIPIRGPIQKLTNMNFTHPSVSRDGDTVFFSASSEIVYNKNDTGSFAKLMERIQVFGVGLQKVLETWPIFQKNNPNPEKVLQALKGISPVFTKVDSPLSPQGFLEEQTLPLLKNLTPKSLKENNKEFPGITNQDLLRFWLLGLLKDTNISQTDLENKVGAKIWMSDLFGGALKIVAPHAPVPQKFPIGTINSDFVVFEAGTFKNRHLFVAEISTGKSLKLTSAGTYNSSPGLSFDDQFVYFESNESGKKEIRKAQLNWNEIKKNLK